MRLINERCRFSFNYCYYLLFYNYYLLSISIGLIDRFSFEKLLSNSILLPILMYVGIVLYVTANNSEMPEKIGNSLIFLRFIRNSQQSLSETCQKLIKALNIINRSLKKEQSTKNYFNLFFGAFLICLILKSKGP